MKAFFAGDADEAKRVMKWSGIGGLALLVVATAISIGRSLIFFGPYLVAWTFWIQVSGGCLVLALIGNVGGGRWGDLCGAALRATRWTWELLIPLAVPLVIGARHLYPAIGYEDAGGYRSFAGYVIRMAVYLLCLGLLAWRALRVTGEAWKGSGLGLLLLGLVFSFASVDWTMALTDNFHSSVYPFVWIADSFVAALAWLAFSQRSSDQQEWEAGRYQLGKLLLASVLFWGYVAVSQLIVIWSASSPHETQWYQDRVAGGWLWWTVLVALCHFVLPVIALLSRQRMRSPRKLAMAGGLILLAHFLVNVWMILPSVKGGGYSALVSALLGVGMGGVWLAAWTRGYLAIKLAEAGKVVDVD